jgi:hypothetical protein
MFLLLIFFITQPLLTGKTIQNLPPNDYTYTRAICNKTNFCQDNIIACKGNELISITPIINATIQHSENWKDPRNKTDFCE